MPKKGGQQQQQAVTLDPGTQQFVEGQLRPAATEAANVALNAPQGFFNPVTAGQQQAISGLQGTQEQLQNFFQQAGGAAQGIGLGLQQGLGGIEQFFNPFQENVIAGVQSDFDRQRQLTSQNAAQQATQAGAFGGSRGAVLENLGLQDVNRAESQTLANIRQGGFQNAANQLFGQRQLAGQIGLGGLQGLGQGISLGGGLAQTQFGLGEGLRGIQNQLSQEDLFRQAQRLGFLNQGIGPFGQTGTTSQQGSTLGGIAGGALTGSAFGLPGAIAGGVLGGIGGLF